MTRGGAAASGTTAARFALGASLGSRYEIQALLGQGGMGAVYKAHDRELDRTVAIKVIRPEMAQNPDVFERFKREIILASKVTHKNVLRIHDFGEAGDVKFISMNYVEGESLTQLLQREGPLSIDRALPFVTQIGEALAGGPRGRRRPPRPEAAEHPHRSRGTRVHRGFRNLEVDGIRRHDHGGGEPDRHRGLHVPRAGARREVGHARGPLFVRRDPLRDADRESSRSRAATLCR